MMHVEPYTALTDEMIRLLWLDWVFYLIETGLMCLSSIVVVPIRWGTLICTPLLEVSDSLALNRINVFIYYTFNERHAKLYTAIIRECFTSLTRLDVHLIEMVS